MCSILFPKELKQVFNQLVLKNCCHLSHLVTQSAQVIDLNDGLTSVSAVGLLTESVKQVSLLVYLD